MTVTRKAQPAPINISKNEDGSNKKALRALVIKAKGEESESNALLEDEFTYTLSNRIIEPPYHLLTLSTLKENSTELLQCIDAMVTNIDGFGYRLIETATPKELKDNEELKATILEEKARIAQFLDNVNFDQSITSLRKSTRKNLEETGNAYWELVPNVTKNTISSINRLPSHTIRLVKQDDEYTETEIRYLNKVSGQIESRNVKKRFRRFIQKIGTRMVFFKEWGDPRDISAESGEVVTDLATFKGRLAHPVLHFKIESDRTPYGLPRYIGNLFSIYGSRSADEINFVTFQNNNIPSMLVLVSNGQLTNESIKRIEEFVETKIKGSSNRSSFLILEAETADDTSLNPGTMKLETRDLSSAQKDDQLFQEYDKNNSDKIRRCFRLPPIFVGKSSDYNRSTAQESRKLADEQIFAPERYDFDTIMNKILIKDLGMQHHVFKSNSANVTNDEDLVAILSSSEKTGGVTPNTAREILSDILNKELPLYDPAEVDFDPDIPLSLTLVDRAKVVAGNEQSGILAPNQGQIPASNEQSATKVLKDLEKMLTADIYSELIYGIG